MIEECQESGLTVKEFCRQRDLREGAYYYWLRKVRDGIAESIGPTLVELNENRCSGVGTSHHEDAEDALHIEYRGMKLEIPGDANMDGLPALLHAMQKL